MTKALCAFLVPVVAVGGFAVSPRFGKSATSLPSPSLQQAAIVALAAAAASVAPASPSVRHPAKAAPSDRADLQTAVDQHWVSAEFKGNGRERMRAIFKNQTGAPLLLQVPAGQMLQNAQSAVIIVRSGELELRPGIPTEVMLETAATRSANPIGDADFRLSSTKVPRLDALFAHAQAHPELSTAAIQTAVLALGENLPLHAVAKFTSSSGDLASRFDTTAFRVETFDLISALTALRAIGVKDSEVAMTIDPQLKIEAMTEPASRAAARRYYGLSEETEWEFWKTELLGGDPSTRHYALYGIARFYPEVALQMLPKWAREVKTGAVYRLSAIQALANTQRPEALPILRQLTEELGRDTQFGRAAAVAAQYLETHLAKLAASGTSVASAK